MQGLQVCKFCKFCKTFLVPSFCLTFRHFFTSSTSLELRVHRAGSQLTMSECQTKAGNQECFKKFDKLEKLAFTTFTLSFSLSLTLSLSFTHSQHAEQLLISCLCSKVTFTLPDSHTLSISQSLTLNMLNKFCFHVYAQKLLLIGENVNVFFDLLTLPCEFRVRRAGSLIRQERAL